jgi:hypothetical protein
VLAGKISGMHSGRYPEVEQSADCIDPGRLAGINWRGSGLECMLANKSTDNWIRSLPAVESDRRRIERRCFDKLAGTARPMVMLVKVVVRVSVMGWC